MEDAPRLENAIRKLHRRRLGILGSCHLWRNAVRDIPAFWSHVFVIYNAADGYADDATIEPPIEHLQRELKWAGSKLLALTVYSRFSEDLANTDVSKPYEDALLQCLAGCETLNIISYNHIIRSLVQGHRPATLPKLKRFRLEVRDGDNSDLLDLSSAPLLQHLSVKRFSGPIKFHSSKPIIILKLSVNVPFEIAVQILPRCPELKFLYWEFKSPHIENLPFHHLFECGL